MPPKPTTLSDYLSFLYFSSFDHNVLVWSQPNSIIFTSCSFSYFFVVFVVGMMV
ncbi:hypothetical protein Scep_027043 [Stephania cephalantha]|uniref:Uncharacterized protein n=1 Tax=Stephania cephalantha TaxID=152367 RepID=A0AAP0EV75_9MAGN